MWITGTGVLSCAGTSPQQLWSSLMTQTSGLTEGLGPLHNLNFQNDRALSMCLTAAQQAMTEAGWDSLREDDGVILATTTGQILL